CRLPHNGVSPSAHLGAHDASDRRRVGHRGLNLRVTWLVASRAEGGSPRFGSRCHAVHFRILGPLEIVDDDLRPIELDSPRLRAVTCRLLMDAGRIVPHDTIVASVWGDEPPAAANGTLQTYVSRLRRVLEPDRAPRTPARVLMTRPPGYMVALGDGTLDSDEL